MKYSMLLGGALALAASSALAAVPAAKGTFQADGFTTAGTCAAPGTPSSSSVIYPGASTATSSKTGFSLAIPISTSAGPASTFNCIQGHLSGNTFVKEAVPTTGLDGNTLNFVCWSDTSTALQSTGTGLAATVAFTVKPTHTATGFTVKTVTTLTGLGCNSTNETTWVAE